MQRWTQLPQGFASLEQARQWSAALEQAQDHMGLLRLCEIALRLEAALALPFSQRACVYASRELPGIEISMEVEADGHSEPQELGALLLAWGREGQLGLTEKGQALVSLHQELRAIEAITRHHPESLKSAKALGPAAEIDPARLSAGASAMSIARALGSEEAARAIERATLEQSAGAGKKERDGDRL